MDEQNLLYMSHELGKFPYELEDLPVDEYDRLLVYFAWKHKLENPKNSKQYVSEEKKIADFSTILANRKQLQK